ncbi:hypothetical protein E1301_Tti004366 [Triplophysa tibetana]|uniref:Uncharacterized protein n=1 Tax=Triplophysa tibetana TaxID=1572043 RepID=A0A5A9N6I5_9TELE|nr:hypothetical protein E1301_Tti004366 [Triplophysa tibetana]
MKKLIGELHIFSFLSQPSENGPPCDPSHKSHSVYLSFLFPSVAFLSSLFCRGQTVVSTVAALTSPSCCAYAETLSVNERIAYDVGRVLRADETKVLAQARVVLSLTSASPS